MHPGSVTLYQFKNLVWLTLKARVLNKTCVAAGFQSRWILIEDEKSHRPWALPWGGELTPHLLLMRLHHLVIIKGFIIEFKQKLFPQFYISFMNINKNKCLNYLENCSKYLCVNQESTFWAYSLALDKIHVWNEKKKEVTNKQKPTTQLFPINTYYRYKSFIKT